MHAHVREATTRTDQLGAEFERFGDAHRLDRHIGPEPAGQLLDQGDGIVARVVDRCSRPKALAASSLASATSIATIWLGEHNCEVNIAARPIGPAPTIATTSPGLDAAVQDADLITRGADVGEHEHALIGNAGWDEIRRGVSERNSHVLGLGAVNRVTEDPACGCRKLDQPLRLGLLRRPECSDSCGMP